MGEDLLGFLDRKQILARTRRIFNDGADGAKTALKEGGLDNRLSFTTGRGKSINVVGKRIEAGTSNEKGKFGP